MLCNTDRLFQTDCFHDRSVYVNHKLHKEGIANCSLHTEQLVEGVMIAYFNA